VYQQHHIYNIAQTALASLYRGIKPAAEHYANAAVQPINIHWADVGGYGAKNLGCWLAALGVIIFEAMNINGNRKANLATQLEINVIKGGRLASEQAEKTYGR
jgi:hypothetical protein